VLRNRSERFFRALDFQQSVDPFGRGSGRYHLIVRTVKKLSRTDTGNTPKLARAAIAGLETLQQSIAQIRLGLQREKFQTCSRAPHLAQ
jgi:hypothetical protein